MTRLGPGAVFGQHSSWALHKRKRRMCYVCRIIGWGLLAVMLISCGWAGSAAMSTRTPARSFLQPPPTFHERDLIGRWELIGPIDAIEILTLTADHQFTQRYAIGGKPESHDVGQGAWWLEQRPSGCVYVHLEGMRYFHGGGVLADHGNRYEPGGTLHTFVEKCEDRLITMPDKVVLIVTNRPRLPRGIGLLFPKSGRDNADNSMLLTADADGQPLPLPTALSR